MTIKNKKQSAVLRLTEELYSKPHLISPSSFYAITSYLEKRNQNMLMKFEETDDSEEEDDKDKFDPFSGVGVINVYGALTYRPVSAMCGAVGMSYTDLLEDVTEMIDEGASTIILNIDSGGGECYGCFESANDIRKKCDEAGVFLVAYVDGQSCSAAYALSCVADEVVANPYAEIGSIGVLIGLVSDSEAMKMEGYQRTFIYAGNEKIPFAEDGSWKQSFLDSLQESVDDLYLEFTSFVAKYTGLSVAEVKATEAKVFKASKALEIGLVNKVMTRSEFIDYITKKHKRGNLDA